MAADPVAAVALAVRVSVLPLVAGLGLNAAVMPLGKPVAERVTLPLEAGSSASCYPAYEKVESSVLQFCRNLWLRFQEAVIPLEMSPQIGGCGWRSKTLQGRMTRTWVGRFPGVSRRDSLGIR